jgi:hypothetical protein
MTTADWAAWVQAVGSIAAIGAGFATLYFQNRRADKLRERDRTDRAEVVALRLSGWLSEVGALIQTKSEDVDTLRKHNPVMPPLDPDLVNRMKLDATASIESAMSDLHYLKVGSGDVAQLDFFIRDFDAYLNKALRMTPERGRSAGSGRLFTATLKPY